MRRKLVVQSGETALLQGNDTRARMILSAIEVFAQFGYAGASTRALAERAGVNLAAIPYHFGGKRELYLAAAQAIADYASSRIDPLIADLRDGGSAGPADRIRQALRSFFHLLVGRAEPEAWTEFLVRCERDADDAFRIIHHQALARFQSALIDTLAEANPAARDDDDLKMRIAVVLTSYATLRTLRNVTLASLGWAEIDDDRLARLEIIMSRIALRELLGEFNDPAASTPSQPSLS